MALSPKSFPAAWLWRRLTSRWAVRLYAACAMLLLIFATVIQVEAHILRYRAEHLLADIRQLELRKSTWADAQKLMTRWGAWGHYDGSCTAAECEYQIVLTNASYVATLHDGLPHLTPFDDGRDRKRPIVGHPISVVAGFNVLDGVVWGKSFSVLLEFPHPFSFKGAERPDSLLMGATSASRLSHQRWPSSFALHGDYLIGARQREGLIISFANFTPYADPTDVRRLMDINLACITRWLPCREQKEIMPAASRQQVAEEEKLGAIRRSGGCEFPRAALGRETEEAALAEVIAVRGETDATGESSQNVSFRLEGRLKRAQFWPVNLMGQGRLYDWSYWRSAGGRPQVAAAGSHVVLLLEAAPEGNDKEAHLHIYPCGVIPFTPQNLAEVQRGIDEDYLYKRSIAAKNGAASQ